MSNSKVAYVLKRQEGDKLISVGNAIENPQAKFQPAFSLVNDSDESLGMVIDPTKDGNLVLKTATKDAEGKTSFNGICVLFKSLSKAGKVYYRGKNKETGEVYRMFQNDRAA